MLMIGGTPESTVDYGCPKKTTPASLRSDCPVSVGYEGCLSAFIRRDSGGDVCNNHAPYVQGMALLVGLCPGFGQGLRPVGLTTTEFFVVPTPACCVWRTPCHKIQLSGSLIKAGKDDGFRHSWLANTQPVRCMGMARQAVQQGQVMFLG